MTVTATHEKVLAKDVRRGFSALSFFPIARITNPNPRLAPSAIH